MSVVAGIAALKALHAAENRAVWGPRRCAARDHREKGRREAGLF